MKKGALALIVAVLGSAFAYCLYFYCATQPVQAMLTKPAGAMEWLRGEFELNDAQFGKIKALHEAYMPKCAFMCQRIAEANSKVDVLVDQNQSVTPEIESALKNASLVEEESRQQMLAHIYAVSAEMNAQSGRRYLAMMKPRLIQVGLASTTAVSPNAPSRQETR